MPKYFMGDTRLEAFERMMMDPSRSRPHPEKPRKRRRPQKMPARASGRKPREGGV